MVVLLQTSKTGPTNFLILNSPLIMPNIQEETVANNKDIKISISIKILKGKKNEIRSNQTLEGIAQRGYILVDAQSQLDKILSKMSYHPRWICL